jgi:hypothetical protein
MESELLMTRFIIVVSLYFLGGCGSQPAPAAPQTPLATTGPASRDGQMQLGNFSVSLAVKDIAASRAFYEKLGFRQVAGDQAQNWLILQNSTSTIGLFQGPEYTRNMLTFNPGWDRTGGTLPDFDDVRDIQRTLRNRVSCRPRQPMSLPRAPQASC